MSDDLPTGALQKRLGAGAAKGRALMANPFGGGGAIDDDNFSALEVPSAASLEGGGGGLQEMGLAAATGAANAYLQQRTYGVVGLGGGGGEGGATAGLTIGGFGAAELSSMSPGAADLSRVGGGAANNFLQSRTGGVVSFNADGVAEGSSMGVAVMSALAIGGTSAATLSTNADEAQRLAHDSANAYLQNKTGGAVSMAAGGAGLTVGTGGALTRGMDPIAGALATHAVNAGLSDHTGGIVSLDKKGNLQIKSNETVDRRLQEARAAATVAGAAAIGGASSAINMGTSAPREGGAGGFGGGGGAVFDVARSEFQARWSRVAAEEEQLRLQALDIDRRERQLAMRTTKQTPNFPPLRLFCIKPVVHHDIAGSIPQARQTFVKACYGTFYGTVLLLIANLVMIIVNVATCGESKLAHGDRTTFLKHLILPIFYALAGSFGAFFVWYYPTYSACGSGSSINYVTAFIGLFVGLAFAVFQSVGPLGYGGAGFLYAVTTGSRCGTSNLLMIVPVAILWACLAVCMFAYIIKLRLFYKEDSASLDAAREQLKAQMR